MNPSNGFISTSGTTADAYWMLEDVQYNMRVWQANSSNHYTVVPSYSSTFTPANYPTITVGVSISSRYQGGLSLTWTGVDCDYYTLAYSLDNATWSYVYNITSNSYSLSGLQHGATYYLKVRGHSNYDKPSSSYSSANTGTTLPGIPSSITVVASATPHTVTVGFTKGYSYSGYTVTTDINWTKTDGSWGSPPEYESQSGTSYPIDVTSEDDTFFRFRSQITVSGTTLYSDWSSTYSVYIVTRPDDWSFSFTIATDEELAVDGKNIYLMDASEWNNFTARINDFRIYKGLALYSFTTMYSESEFTKTIINEALTAIRDMSAYFTGGKSVDSNRSTGDSILVASYYTKMRDALNSIA